MAPHDSVVVEDPLHAYGERLGAVDHDEESLLEAKSPFNGIGQEVLQHRRVLHVTFQDPDGDLRAVCGDHQRPDAAALVEDDAIDLKHGGVVNREDRGEELDELLPGRGHEAPRDRSLGVSSGDSLELVADGFGDELVTSGGHAGRRLFDGHLGEEVLVAEQRVGPEVDLLTLGLRRSCVAHRHDPATEDDRAECRLAAHAGPLWVVAALCSDPVGELCLHELGDDLEPDQAAERHQVVFERFGDVCERDGCLRRQLCDSRRLVFRRDEQDG